MAQKAPVIFAGRAVPKGTERWSAFDTEGTRRMWKGADDVEVGDFPLAELSPDTLRSRWGAGWYRIQFIGTRGGKPKALGSREVVLGESPQVAPAPAPVVVAPQQAAAPASSELQHAFLIADAIDRRAAIATERDRSFLQTCLAVAVNNRPAEPSAEVAALRAELAALRASIATPAEDDEDEDDEPTTAADARPFRVGESIGDAALVTSLNGIAEMIGSLAPALQALVVAKLDQEVRKVAAQAQQAQQAANGAAPGASAT